MKTVIYATPTITPAAIKNANNIHERMLSVVLKCCPSSLLEIGAGQGYLGSNFVKHGIDYVGIEPVENEIIKARQRYPELTIIQASCYDEPDELRGRKFDLIYSNDIIEHLYEPRKLVSFSKSYLREGGMIVCGTPHYGSYFRNLALSLTNRWDRHFNPLWDGGHIKFFSKRTLYQIWDEGGFADFEWGTINRFCLPMYLFCIAKMK